MVCKLWSGWLHVEHFGNPVYTDYFGFRALGSSSYMPVGRWLTWFSLGILHLDYQGK